MDKRPRMRHLTIIAQDPDIKDEEGNILKTQVEIPAENFEIGPSGYRVKVIDYDSSTNTLYGPKQYDEVTDGEYPDPFANCDDEELLNNPNFHSQNVYAIIMWTIARFEFALGRRIDWYFDGHQIQVAPHAFADANAFYSRDDRALMFGYFKTRKRKRAGQQNTAKYVFTCLSHDVIAHETTHAILDGMRSRFTAPSSPEQAGFHEGFADIVALLSVFSSKEVVQTLLTNSDSKTMKNYPSLISIDSLEKEQLKKSALFGLAKQMGGELSAMRGDSLRRSITIEPIKEKKCGSYLDFKEHPEFELPHRCGELLVAAVMNAFLDVWSKRIDLLKNSNTKIKYLDCYLIAEQAKDAATQLLTMTIRALDYTPPTDLKFGDYLSALLTSDAEAVPDDSKYEYRKILKKSFADYGIEPSSKSKRLGGKWAKVQNDFVYDHTHFDSLLQDRNEVFRFIWANRAKLQVDKHAYTVVESVRPCLRVAPDGFVIRETVAEYVQISNLKVRELLELDKPIQVDNELPRDLRVRLYGGGSLIFDEYGRLKYHVNNRIYSSSKQEKRLKYLWKYGYLSNVTSFNKDLFMSMHLQRTAGNTNTFLEEF